LRGDCPERTRQRAQPPLAEERIGALIESWPLGKGQVGREIRNSLSSIVIFVVYGVLTVFVERRGYVDINWDPNAVQFIINMSLLVLWNECHFYICHRGLHTPWLFRRIHVVPTLFSMYSFHWFEATLLSSVMLLLLLGWPLDIITVLVFPGISLVANSIGHMNYAVFPGKAHSQYWAACQRHTAHHTRWVGHYGFYLPRLDSVLGTRVQPKGSVGHTTVR
jgi:lathosterol oxidase